MTRPRVFLSYSHVDSTDLERLLPYLDALSDHGTVDVWTDTRIRPGARWREEIDAALDGASIAILLITQTFLSSRFVREEELPRILARQQAGRLTVLPVFLKPSTVTSASIPVQTANGDTRSIVLSEFQGFGTPARALSELSEPERQRRFVELHDRIRELSARASASAPKGTPDVPDAATRTQAPAGQTVPGSTLTRALAVSLAVVAIVAVVIALLVSRGWLRTPVNHDNPTRGAGETRSALASLAPIEWVGGWTDALNHSGIGIVKPYVVVGTDETSYVQVGRISDEGRRFVFDHTIDLAPPSAGGVELDIEGIAISGQTVYAIGSHSSSRARYDPRRSDAANASRMQMIRRHPERDALFRFVFDPSVKSARQLTSISLRPFIEQNDQLKPFASLAARENGIELEGIAARGDLLYAGLRGPVVSGRALVIRFDFDAADRARILRLDMGGLGIRDLATISDGFLVLAGPAGPERSAHKLYKWDGTDALEREGGPGGVTHELTVLPDCGLGPPEGIAVLSESAVEYQLVVIYDLSSTCASLVTIRK